jgi:zinc finger BED domain-containing protein 1 (E3 SUMO-protein ligase ZBED1)
MSRNKSSPVWAHFELQVTQKSVKCKICHDVLSYNGSTGTMLNHMKRHPTARTNNQENVQSSILPYVISNASQTRKCNNVRKEEIDQLLCEMIVGDMLPLDFVQSPYFLRLIHFLEPEYKVPCVKRFVHLLENKYNNARNALKDEIGEANTVALTTDCWTSLTTEAYMTVTCHFVTPDWKLRSVVLCTESTQDERHTGRYNNSELIPCIAFLIFNIIYCIHVR